MTFIKDCKPDFEKIKERVKSSPEVECTGKCYGCQAMCIHKIPKIPEEALGEVLLTLETWKISSEIQQKFPEETINESLPILETIVSALEKRYDR